MFDSLLSTVGIANHANADVTALPDKVPLPQPTLRRNAAGDVSHLSTPLMPPTLRRQTAQGVYSSEPNRLATPLNDNTPPQVHQCTSTVHDTTSSEDGIHYRSISHLTPSSYGSLNPDGSDGSHLQDITAVFDDLEQTDLPEFQDLGRAHLRPALKVCPTSDSIREFYAAPSAQYDTDAGYDLYFPETMTIPPGDTVMCDFGVSVQGHDEDLVPCAIQMLPRSSIVKTPLRMANSFGLIDASYRGTLRVYLDNIKNEPHTIQKGDRLFQLVAPSLRPFEVTVVDELPATERGEDGFGSTGK